MHSSAIDSTNVILQPITIGNEEMEGKNSVYLLESDGTVALIDAGSATEDSHYQFVARLENHGYELSGIDIVVLTHWHRDHTGLVSPIRRSSGATVYVHEADAPIVRCDPDAVEGYVEDVRNLFREWGVPEKNASAYLESFKKERGYSRGVETTSISAGDRITIGNIRLEVIHTPGHTVGHCCFAFEGNSGREAFVGDAILPVYTPNVGGSDARLEAPLERYVTSLRRLMDAGLERCWPGHRDVIEEPAARARTILEHHRERARRVVGSLRERKQADVWKISNDIFDRLEGTHAILGAGEVYAHVDHLYRAGVLERNNRTYRLRTDREPDYNSLV